MMNQVQEMAALELVGVVAEHLLTGRADITKRAVRTVQTKQIGDVLGQRPIGAGIDTLCRGGRCNVSRRDRLGLGDEQGGHVAVEDRGERHRHDLPGMVRPNRPGSPRPGQRLDGTANRRTSRAVAAEPHRRPQASPEQLAPVVAEERDGTIVAVQDRAIDIDDRGRAGAIIEPRPSGLDHGSLGGGHRHAATPGR